MATPLLKLIGSSMADVQQRIVSEHQDLLSNHMNELKARLALHFESSLEQQIEISRSSKGFKEGDLEECALEQPDSPVPQSPEGFKVPPLHLRPTTPCGEVLLVTNCEDVSQAYESSAAPERSDPEDSDSSEESAPDAGEHKHDFKMLEVWNSTGLKRLNTKFNKMSSLSKSLSMATFNSMTQDQSDQMSCLDSTDGDNEKKGPTESRCERCMARLIVPPSSRKNLIWEFFGVAAIVSIWFGFRCSSLIHRNMP
jgi:hypothetical protein